MTETKREKHLQTTINAFEDKFGKTFDITLLFSDTLEQFEKHLRSVRNSLGYSKFIVGECLNHSLGSLKVTDKYIKKEFTWMDEINRKVIDLVFGKEG